MLISAAGLLAILAYLAATGLLAGLRLWRNADDAPRQRAGHALLGLAVLGHGLALLNSSFTATGLNVSLINAASLVACCISALLLLLLLWRPLASLAVVIMPLAALALGLDLALPTAEVLRQSVPPGLGIHIALAIIAYSLFAIAAVQALLLAVAERQLRQHHPIMHFLPPLPVMETVMFQLTLLAFGLLTLSLGLGALYIEDIHGQHLAHKIVFSLLAWTVFAVLVVGRWRYGWRGRHGVKYVAAGWALLALAYFGTKVVLELLLHRA